eukprot:CAMPEP_0194026948 /NCGR_PEP_ID=MMETSP0009_2-20130614/1189_1 /TAXON_ID=210454 /ORGANISM="Grammatophora oceanica, Strain CCMP 410" /LENGTH=195 /DNA_ID=CAMNT_0038665847 /DNA_START=24 /DNA_END=611 /DNA_ORIENTATION=+
MTIPSNNNYANATLIDSNDTTAPSAPAGEAPFAAATIPQAKLLPYGASTYNHTTSATATAYPSTDYPAAASTTAVPQAQVIKNPSIQGITTTSTTAAQPTRYSTITYNVHAPQPSSAEAQERHATILRRRKRRARGEVASIVGGVVVGGVLLGPIGVIVGVFGAPAVTRAALSRGEKRKDQRVQARRDAAAATLC